jgi:hypothetical protein
MPATTIDGVVGMWEILADGGRRGSDAKTPEAASPSRKTYPGQNVSGEVAYWRLGVLIIQSTL